jgi:hypothetical protein
MFPKGPDETATEITGYVRKVERWDGKRLIEAVAFLGPSLERGRHENQESTAVNGAGSTPECVRTAGVVAVEDDTIVSLAEEFVGPGRGKSVPDYLVVRYRDGFEVSRLTGGAGGSVATLTASGKDE